MVAQPAITAITKSISPAGPYYAGSALTYSMTFTNDAVGNNATTAFDIVLTDTLDANLTAGTVNVSSTQGGTCAGGLAFSTGNSTVGQVVTVNVSCLDPGSSVTVTIDAIINASTAPATLIILIIPALSIPAYLERREIAPARHFRVHLWDKRLWHR